MMKEVLDTMPKKPDDSLKTQQGTYTVERQAEGGTYLSQKEASKKWEQKNPMEKIIVRVPEGSRDIITEYVEQKALEDPTNLKYSSYNGKAYRPSVNALIKALLEEELGRTLD